MSVLLLPPIFQFFDDNGDPLANGFVDTYAAGTTTRLATYTDSTGTIEAPNPIELDAAGRPTSGSGAIWGQGAYKFIVRDSNGVQVGDTLDNVISFTGLAAATNAYAQTFSGDGTTTVFTTSDDLGTDPKSLLVSVASGLQQIVQNGDFATDTIWTKGAGWTIAAGVATATGAISTAISQVPVLTVVAGQAYAVTYTITRSAGGLIPSIGGQNGTERTASGTYREIIIAAASTPLAWTGNAFTGTLDSVSVTVATSQPMALLPSNAYTINGTTLTFASAPALGVNNIDVRAPSLLLGAASTAANLAQLYAANALVSETNAAASALLAATVVKWKPAVACATTANITLSGEQTIDTVLTSASRVLVKDQTNATQNGVYVSAAGAWTRATDADTWTEITSQAVFTSGGSANINKSWVNTNESGGTIGVTNITWTQLQAFGDMSKNVYDPANIAQQLVGTTATQTLSGKTLTAPVINGNATGTGLPNVCEGRLTLTSGLPVTTADVTGATNIYFTPYIGNKVSIYTGSTWFQYTFTEMTLALGTLTSGRPYDVFLDYNSGTPQLVSLSWTNDTTRATALVYQNGVLVKSGATTQRYLGTFYTTATTTTEDSDTKRYLWNYYNRISRRLRVLEATASWTYSTAAYRQTRATATNQVEFVTGVAENALLLTAQSYWSNSAASNRICYTGIGLDSTTVNSADLVDPVSNYATASNYSAMRATYNAIPAAGRHYLAWLEYGSGADTQTWRGANAPAQSGLTGNILA